MLIVHQSIPRLAWTRIERAPTKTAMDARFPRVLEHDPEKWKPVFRKDHAQTK
jgi:hypothetical protein